jgi:hypothetical protein
MFENLTLQSLLAVLDLESTGTGPRKDRILKLWPDGRRKLRAWRVNPNIPIPAEAIHNEWPGPGGHLPHRIPPFSFPFFL